MEIVYLIKQWKNPYDLNKVEGEVRGIILYQKFWKFNHFLFCPDNEEKDILFMYKR